MFCSTGAGHLTTFLDLDHDARLARLTSAAHAILPTYNLGDAHLHLIQYIGNAVFVVTSPAEERFALRLHPPGRGSDEGWRSELMWLRALYHLNERLVPPPISTLAGDLLAFAPLDDHDRPVSVALFAWLDGQPVNPNHLTPNQVSEIGRLLGRLHRAAVDFAPPPSFVRPMLDWEGLFGVEGLYPIAPGTGLITPKQALIFSQTSEQVRRTMDSIGQSPDAFGLIHGDFIAKNLLWTPDGPAALDFETCGFGYFLYDLAPLLLQFKGRPEWNDLRDALVSGYTQQRLLSTAHLGLLETFIAARHLASCRWLAAHLDRPMVAERAPSLLAGRAAELAVFLDTGNVPSTGQFL